MDKNKELTKEQCKPLFDILQASTREGITKALKFASEHEGYDSKEVKIFIKNHFEVVVFLIDNIIDNVVCEQINHFVDRLANNIDFPNSHKNFEDKSSDTKNTER